MPGAAVSPVAEDSPAEKFPPVSQDLEKNVRRSSYGFKRQGTGQSSFSKQNVSCGTTLHSSTLERLPTLRVEDDALHGYPKLASHLGSVEGYAIYRRFAALNSRNLLYHQAKLIQLEHDLNTLEQAFSDQHDLHYSVHNIFSAESGPGAELKKKHEEVSTALDKYNKLLLDQQRLHSLSKPDDVYVKSLSDFIFNTKSENPDWLTHPEDKVYACYTDGTPIQTDLVTINRALRTHDPFSRFFTSTLLQWWHAIRLRISKPDTELGEYIYTDKAMGRWMRAIVMIAASALPTCSIVVLYVIHSETWRLIFIVLFSGVFAAALSFFTEGRSIEIFTASVALASVQVVFVGTAFGNGTGNGNVNNS